jgi:hypothetical protein
MIKLLDILEDMEQGMKEYNNMTVNDHLDHIIKHAQKAKESNNPKDINESITEIMEHIQAVNDKNYFAKNKSGMHSADDGPMMTAHASDIVDSI